MRRRCNKHIPKKCRATGGHGDKAPEASPGFPVSQLLAVSGRKDSELTGRTLRSTTSIPARDHQRPSRTPWKPHRDPGRMRNDYANIDN